MKHSDRTFAGAYEGPYLDRVAFPLGGLGAGMIALEGSGTLSHVSLRNRPDVFHEPLMFSALCIKGKKGKANVARVLEGPVPSWKIMFPWGAGQAGNGGGGKTYGLPRFARASFQPRFPFASVRLRDPKVPVRAEVTGWSPFIPGQADDCSLPVAALEYTFRNPSKEPVDLVYSFHACNFMRWREFDSMPFSERPRYGVRLAPGGFALFQEPGPQIPWAQGAMMATVEGAGVRVNARWFRGGWFDPLMMLWQGIEQGLCPQAGPYTEGEPSDGGSLAVAFKLKPGGEKTIRLRLSWFCPASDLRLGEGRDDAPPPEVKGDGTCGCGCKTSDLDQNQTHRPWYASQFADVEAVGEHWDTHYKRLRRQSQAFADCFYDTTLPPEVIEAVAANLTILKSPTVLRQADGRLWVWEGCCDQWGCCAGSCTHVWNYAQALPHLFPELERSLRQTEFGENQDGRGHQNFRACLPIRPNTNTFHAAADGQLGGIMKVWREWRVSGDTPWMADLWPRVRQSLDYCIQTWDPGHEGLLREPHHNTYDIEFWGPDGMCGSFYLGALVAACAMGRALGEDVASYEGLAEKARRALEGGLFDGEYFIQNIQWQGLRAEDPTRALSCATHYTPEALEILRREGPKYQYGKGCLSDGALGDWMARVCGLGPVLDRKKVKSHLKAVFKYNFRADLSEHANPQRPTYAVGKEGGLVLCSWPKGGRLSLPFVYSEEVWTGVEYQVASHLMMNGCVRQGLEIVRALRRRYDGRVRNPFNEFECGHWYARAMASYGLLQGLTGQCYDAVQRKLTLRPQVKGDWRAFLCTASGWGTVGMKKGKPFVEVKSGKIPIKSIEVLV